MQAWKGSHDQEKVSCLVLACNNSWLHPLLILGIQNPEEKQELELIAGSDSDQIRAESREQRAETESESKARARARARARAKRQTHDKPTMQMHLTDNRQ
jgi:hypothetical protein